MKPDQQVCQVLIMDIDDRIGVRLQEKGLFCQALVLRITIDEPLLIGAQAVLD